MTNHECGIDCKLEITPTGGKAHVMYANLPSSAAGRYQWEGNARIFRQGRGARAAWRKTGQDQTRECRVWEQDRKHNRLQSRDGYTTRAEYRILSTKA